MRLFLCILLSLVVFSAGCSMQPNEKTEVRPTTTLPVSSCFPSDNTVEPSIIGTIDHDERFKENPAFSFIETQNIFAGIWYQDSFIRYYDKSTGLSDPLCGRPECTHTGSDCNACVFNQSKGLSYYEGKLYWMGYESDPGRERALFSVMRMNLDGSGRESVHSEEIKQLLSGKGFDSVFFHRGYVYFVIEEVKVEAGSPSVLHSVFRISLDDPNDNAYVLSFLSTNPVETRCFFSENSLIVLLIETLENGTDRSFDLLAWKIELSTLKQEPLLEERGADFYAFDAQYYDGELYLSGWRNTEDSSGTIPCVCVSKQGKLEVFFDFIDENVNYDIGVVGWGFAFSCYENERREPYIWLIDLSGTTLYRGKLDLAGLGGTDGFRLSSIVLVGGDAEAFVILIMYRIDGEYHASFIRYSMEGGELKGELLFTGNKTLGR